MAGGKIMNFSSWRVKSKIILSIVLSFIMFLSMGIIAILVTGKVYKDGSYIVSNSVPSMDTAHSIDTATSDYLALQYAHIISTDKNEMANLEKKMADKNAQIQQLIQKYNKDLISNDTDKTLISNVKLQWDDYMKISDQVITLSKELKTEDALRLMNGQATSVYSTSNKTLNDLVSFNEKFVNDNGQSIQDKHQDSQVKQMNHLILP